MAAVGAAIGALGSSAGFLTALKIGGTLFSIAGQLKQQSAAKKAQKKERERAAAQRRREQRAAIRQRQIAAARAANAAAAQGTSGGSGLAGGTTGLASTIGSGIGYQGYIGGLNDQMMKYNQQAVTFGNYASFGQSIAGWASKRLDALNDTQSLSIPNYTQ